MIDRIFAAVLTFCLLVAGTLAIAAMMIGADQRAPAPRSTPMQGKVVQLETVVITAKRIGAPTVVSQTDCTDAMPQGAAQSAASVQ